ncbi:MAG: RelA/SpoT domain-containing protein [Patescibacteria group bacterium]|jgi:ppGpp synthetase/RelA/SpoT-type nucleotidyltranferase
MAWTEIKYSKNLVNRAGDTLISQGSSTDEINEALMVLDNWRSAHSFPLHIFKKRLKVVSSAVDDTSLVVQRLKRSPAILRKLQRRYGELSPTMKLSQMQDIGGCRAVLANVKLVNKICSEYYHTDKANRGEHCDLKHQFKNKKDYINNPKDDGYRGVHLIYKYISDKSNKYNGLLIEIQVRSKLQHLWATAVETVGHFTKQALKSNEGEEDWITFFKLVSSVFAQKEKTPPVPDTPIDGSELFRQVEKLSNKLQVVEKIKSWAESLRQMEQIEQNEPHKPHFYLLELDIDTRRLAIRAFDKKDEETANQMYSAAEKRASEAKANRDIVLVEADTTKELQRAYPNYFLDTKEFIQELENYLNNAEGIK